MQKGDKMKYLTKQWYCDVQNTFYYHRFHVSKKADVFSEEYFTYLYKKRLREHKNWCKETDEEEHEIYNEKEAIADFEKMYANALSAAKEVIPKDIVSEIADLRILALDIVNSDIYKKLKAYCKNLDNQTENAMKNYDAYYKQIKESLPEGIQNLHMHDCEITDASFDGNDFVMDIDSDGGYVEISKLVLKNAQIIQHSEKLVGAIWLYDEVYQVDGRYELHMLLLSENRESLEEMTILIDNVEYIV